jgi:hypothetical protein
VFAGAFLLGSVYIRLCLQSCELPHAKAVGLPSSLNIEQDLLQYLDVGLCQSSSPSI